MLNIAIKGADGAHTLQMVRKKIVVAFHTQEIVQKSFLVHFTPKKSFKKDFWAISHPRNAPKKFFGPFRTQEMRQKRFLDHFAPVKCATPSWLPQLREGKHVQCGRNACPCPVNGWFGIIAVKLHQQLPPKGLRQRQNSICSYHCAPYWPKTCRRTCLSLTFNNVY